MILLLGANGYIAEAFIEALNEQGLPFQAVSRSETDYTRFEPLRRLLETSGAEFVINAAGFTGRPNVDACETAKADTLLGNLLLPQTIAHACAIHGIPWGHISSGCIYNGARLPIDGDWTLQPDLMKPDVRKQILTHPGTVRGFTETDEPNFTFRRTPCSFYSGSKALAEETLREFDNVYIWRMRIPFDHNNQPRNYLAKLLHYPRIYDNFNSLSHRGDFARACLELWTRKAAPGIYNVTNPGFVSTRQVVDAIREILKPGRDFEFWESDEQFYREGAKTPRSNCILDTAKLAAAGITLRPVEEALDHALNHWTDNAS